MQKTFEKLNGQPITIKSICLSNADLISITVVNKETEYNINGSKICPYTYDSIMRGQKFKNPHIQCDKGSQYFVHIYEK